MKKVFLTVFFLAISSLVFAQQSEQTMFESGLDAYRNKDFNTAQNIFFKLLKEYPGGRLETITKLMLAKAYYKQDNFSAVEIIANNFFIKFPNSAYLDDIHHLLGNTYFRSEKYDEAIGQWLWVVNNSSDERLKELAGGYLFKTMENYLSSEQIEELQQRYRDKILDGAITVIKAKKMIAGGKIDEGEKILNHFLRKEPHHFYADEARSLISGGISQGIANSFIYFKPADGELKEIADQIQQGMLYAIKESQIRNEDTRINFEVVELEESEVSALITGEEKIKVRNPVCMIGPIDANQCAGFSVLSRYEKRPYIIPLSSGTGFTRLSPYAFQLNPDVETKGRFFGEYAVTELEHKKIAVLAPVNEYGKGFVRSFVEAVQANGGEIVTDQWYYLDTQDFTRQFKAIRKKSFQIEFEKYLQDSVEVDTTWSEDELREQYQIFMEQKFEDIQFGQDSTQIPATGIDAILIITTPAFVPYLASQFAFHNIESDILGNEGWNDPEQLKKFQQNVEGLVYVTASYFDPESWNYKEFMNRFRMQMNETPLFYHLLGYDMMKWILQNYKPGMSAEEFKSKLENSELYNGVVENIKFSNKPRVNDQLKVIKFSFGHFIQLK